MGHLLTVAKQTCIGQEIRNTFYWGGNDATLANAQSIIDAMRDAWYDNLRIDLAPEWTLYAFDVYDKTQAHYPGVEYIPTSGSVVGANGSDALPPQLAALVNFKAPVPPPNSNRKYLGGLAENNQTDGLFLSGFIADCGAWAADILAVPTTTSLAITLEVVSLAADGTVIGGNPLESYVVRQVPATQKRRRIGVGV